MWCDSRWLTRCMFACLVCVCVTLSWQLLLIYFIYLYMYILLFFKDVIYQSFLDFIYFINVLKDDEVTVLSLLFVFFSLRFCVCRAPNQSMTTYIFIVVFCFFVVVVATTFEVESFETNKTETNKNVHIKIKMNNNSKVIKTLLI